MPAEVEMPAPTRMMARFDLARASAMRSRCFVVSFDSRGGLGEEGRGTKVIFAILRCAGEVFAKKGEWEENEEREVMFDRKQRVASRLFGSPLEGHGRGRVLWIRKGYREGLL